MGDLFSVRVEVGRDQQHEPVLAALEIALRHLVSGRERRITPAARHGDAVLHRDRLHDRDDRVLLDDDFEMIRLAAHQVAPVAFQEVIEARPDE